MKTQKITNKSFERNAKRFLNNAIDTIDTFYPDEKLERYTENYISPDGFPFVMMFFREVKYNTKVMIENLVKEYKIHPFKNHSAFTTKFKGL